jgi:archaellum biogenesis ATPase FlaH
VVQTSLSVSAPELKDFVQFYDAHQNDTFITRESMKTLVLYISFMSRIFTDVFLIIDGLDECAENDRETIINAMKTVQGSTQGSHIMVISRRERDIVQALLQVPNLAMDEKSVLIDIKTHIISRFAAESRLRCRKTEVEDRIRDVLLEKCDGM